jgi:hypothetical protein
MFSHSFLACALLAYQASAHGAVSRYIIGGKAYPG